uniref:Ras-associating domain-containing protein n=1 Tax=Denticeps clupeoides TaxID=299321 RepID=A0AAY4A4D8_9TELE
MFLTVYLSNNESQLTEVPVTPETLCRDVVDLCKEPGETHCYLAEVWRGSERVLSDGERVVDVLQRWGQQRADVRFFLRHDCAPGTDSGETLSRRTPEQNSRIHFTNVATGLTFNLQVTRSPPKAFHSCATVNNHTVRSRIDKLVKNQ